MNISQVVPVLWVGREHVSSENHTYNKIELKYYTKQLTCAIDENIKTAKLLCNSHFDLD